MYKSMKKFVKGSKPSHSLGLTNSGNRCKLITKPGECFCHMHKNADIKFKCVVCIEDAEDPIKLECSHVYCKGCIKKWVENNNISCPQCRNNSLILKHMHLDALKTNDELAAKFFNVLLDYLQDYIQFFIVHRDCSMHKLHKLIMLAFFYKEVMKPVYPEFYEQLYIQLVFHRHNFCNCLFTNLMTMIN